LDNKVKLSHNNKRYERITLKYYSLEELNKILEQMNIQVS